MSTETASTSARPQSRPPARPSPLPAPPPSTLLLPSPPRRPCRRVRRRAKDPHSHAAQPTPPRAPRARPLPQWPGRYRLLLFDLLVAEFLKFLFPALNLHLSPCCGLPTPDTRTPARGGPGAHTPNPRPRRRSGAPYRDPRPGRHCGDDRAALQIQPGRGGGGPSLHGPMPAAPDPDGPPRPGRAHAPRPGAPPLRPAPRTPPPHAHAGHDGAGPAPGKGPSPPLRPRASPWLQTAAPFLPPPLPSHSHTAGSPRDLKESLRAPQR